MAEKKIQENPPPEEPQIEQSTPKMPDKTDKPEAVDRSIPPPVVIAPAILPSAPSFTKTPPNDLYRRLLPAVLFLLTFVTVMTMLLIYMDTVALGAQQFRLNMSRDYELARIPQESAPLVLYVRQLHLSPPPPRAAPPPAPAPPPRVRALDDTLGPLVNGTFIEFLPRGPRDPTTQYLETARGWSGVAVRAAARDYLALRGARALHACLSPTAHPREVTYHEAESAEAAFSSRVLCLPLYTVLLAAEAPDAALVVLAGDRVLPALRHVPFARLAIRILDIRSTDTATRNKTTSFLQTKNYTVAAIFDDGIMYARQQAV